MSARLALLCWLIPAIATAAPPADWGQLNQRLRADGMEPGNVDWITVNQGCIAQGHAANSAPYTACQYDAAKGQLQFKSDKRACDDRVRDMPIMVDPNPVLFLDNPPEHLSQRQQHEIERHRHQRWRYGFRHTPTRDQVRSECMDSKGWRDERNWQAGQR